MIPNYYAYAILVAAFFLGLYLGHKWNNRLWWDRIIENRDGICDRIAKYAREK